jgi:hypothetical protein
MDGTARSDSPPVVAAAAPALCGEVAVKDGSIARLSLRVADSTLDRSTRPDSDHPVDCSTWTCAQWLAVAEREERNDHPAQASAAFYAALRVDPVCVEALTGLARLAALAMDHDAAVEWSRRAVQVKPDDVAARLHLVSYLLSARQLDDCAEVLATLRSDDARVCDVRGTCLVLQGDLVTGMRWLRRAVRLAPASCAARTSLAIGHWRCHERASARRELETARELDPANMHTRFVLMHLLLEQGDFVGGYSDGEAFDAVYPPAIRSRRWRGASIAGKRLLLYDQHGHGDTLQMVRYAQLCAERGATVMLKVRESMIPLLRTLRGVDRLVGINEDNPAFDYQASLLDLPAIFAHAPWSVPQRIPYIAGQPMRRQRIAQWLSSFPRPWIAIAWRGNVRQRDGLIRSCEVADLRPLTRRGGTLINLQLDATPEELATLGARSLPAMDHDGAFLDSAALIACADATVSVDTSVAHLAGALGAPTLLLLPYWSDWRWMADRSDTPWYPTMRLFRQTRPHDWSSAVDAAAHAITILAHRISEEPR